MNRDEATRLIRGDLGCACPPEVLWCLAAETAAEPDLLLDALADLDPWAARRVEMALGAGGRLLVLVARADGPGPAELAERLLRAGAALRDRLGFRRVRVALRCAAGRGAALAAVLPAPPDASAHLHLLEG